MALTTTEKKLLELTSAASLSSALNKIELALNMSNMIKASVADGSKFYEVDKDGEKFIVNFK